MPIYRLAQGMNPDGLPFLFEGNAYLADGTPLTKSDRQGRVTPAEETFAINKTTCSGGVIGLAERRAGIEALARALDKRDAVRAPLLLLFLQIDPAFHKPRGPSGGQFASGQEAGSSTELPPGFQHVAQLIDVQVASTYKEGIPGNEKIDSAHRTVIKAVYTAILLVDHEGFRPGMPGYGQ
jgi:hypothetical protein